MPLMLAIQRRPELWNQNTLRTTYPGTPHAQIDDIWLRFNEIPADEIQVIDDKEAVDYPAYALLPEARSIVMNVFAAVAGERLGRVLITRLPPGAKIAAHADTGAPAAYYDRFHVVLQSAGSMYRCGDEWAAMETGDVWWFQNAIEHEVVNDGPIDRIHLIIDARCSK